MSERASQRVRLPLLDRLMDADPDAPPSLPPTHTEAVEALRTAVRRDLEALLNARRFRMPLPKQMTALQVSPLGYGVPDPTAGSFTEEERRRAMAREVEIAVRRFEPRLTNVRVHLSELDRELFDRTLRVRIEAVLRTDPVPEAITFETLVRPSTLDVAVAQGT